MPETKTAARAAASAASEQARSLSSPCDFETSSWCSQKSEVESHTCFPLTSMRSSGSLGSHESGDRGSRPCFGHAAHIMNGETRFPTAMAYLSDAQRSDVATVCSESVAEDIETESLHSQEDHHNINSLAVPSNRRSANVDFAASSFLPGLGMGLLAQAAAACHPRHDMGPPVNRALLLHNRGDWPSSRPGSVKSYGSNEGHFHGHSDDGGSVDHNIEGFDDHHESPSQPGSVKSYGSHTRSDTGTAHGGDTTDDCACSLDVEDQSVEHRSIHSQDEGPSADLNTSAEINQHPLTNTAASENGRRSPGGTIYKGRGTRRYQGRYMHLPLKRFVVGDTETLTNGQGKNGVYDYRREATNKALQQTATKQTTTTTTTESRSRSRSPSSIDERKPPANEDRNQRFEASLKNGEHYRMYRR